MSIQFDKTNGLSGIGGDVVGGKSLSRMFAELQMMASDNAKTKATDLMDTIKTKQTRLKDAYACKKALQSAKDRATYGIYTYRESYKDARGNAMSLNKWMENNGVANPKSKLSKDDIKAAIARIDTHIESLGTDTQTQMIRLQDFMGQYNNFLQGAHKSIGDGKQTLNAILSR
ncbi:hypothetical protein [Halodesulfovibrio marinisediminis]|uniref:Uncharacterized protein n=1 Tax=Halodesulfovibrio marinisediminis DSM 17456 TaxID=1121457 RepID=A0A1N6I9F1_9BACT|nr:hypothetical protein [Halodesulfovibrio marinisediminis]SIO28647.1 hypothetical protein SAMN02745161_2544 [Halodesulfovibrio marinisediminis DSM 17456]